jgi:transcriptional regulator with XRE-family HTH domain
VETLKQMREARGLTQTELSRISNIAQPNLSTLENGKQYLHPAWARRLAKALRVDVADVYLAVRNDKR